MEKKEISGKCFCTGWQAIMRVVQKCESDLKCLELDAKGCEDCLDDKKREE